MDEYDKKLWQAVKFCLKVVVGIFIFLLAMLFMYSLNSCTTKKHIVKDVVNTSYDSSSVSHTQSSEKKIFENSQKIADTEEEYMLIKFGQDGCIELAADGTKKLKGVQGIKLAKKKQHNQEYSIKTIHKKDSIANNNTVVSRNKKEQHIEKTTEKVDYTIIRHIIYLVLIITLIYVFSKTKIYIIIKNLLKK